LLDVWALGIRAQAETIVLSLVISRWGDFAKKDDAPKTGDVWPHFFPTRGQ